MNGFLAGPTGLYLFLFVLPGILGNLVYEYLVEGEARDTLDRVASSLVLALVGGLAGNVLFGEPLYPHVELRSETPPETILAAFLAPRHLFDSTIVCAAVAIGFAVAQNHGWLYGASRFLRLTRKTGHNDVWQQTFYAFDGRWVSLEFKDGRRLVGWPFRFSSSGQPRALLVADATWYSLDENRAYIARDVAGPGVYIGGFDDVVSMEFLD